MPQLVVGGAGRAAPRGADHVSGQDLFPEYGQLPVPADGQLKWHTQERCHTL